jgi:amidase
LPIFANPPAISLNPWRLKDNLMDTEPSAFLPGPRLTLPGNPGGPLAGLTFAAKDLFDVAGHPTGGGTADWARTHPVPQKHAWAVQTLLEAGADLIGKTITCEISLGILGFNPFFGTPPNPAAPGHMPGGSSSGSASAVAAGLCDIALGTDTGGSVRVPASLCGIYGLRTTHGRVDFSGVMHQAPSFDTAGFFAADAEIFARTAAVMLGEEIAEPSGPVPLLLAEDAFAIADPEVQEALIPAVGQLEKLLGAPAQRMSIGEPGELEIWSNQRNFLQRIEGWKQFKDWIDACNPRFAFSVARNLTLASQMTEDQAALAAVVRARAVARLRLLLEGGAILCIPTTPFTAPKLDIPLSVIDTLSWRISHLASIAGLCGLPQLSLPLVRAGGRPVGLSIIGWRGQDAKLVGIARALARM